MKKYKKGVYRWVEIIGDQTPAREGKGAYAIHYGRCIHFLTRAGRVFDAPYVMFSEDAGQTWSKEDRTPEGEPVERFPAAPPGAEPGEHVGPGEPWLYRAPDGTLILHCWKVNYGNVHRGTWQISSSDNGRTWSDWHRVDFRGVDGDERVFATDDHFVYDGVVYAGARKVSGRGWRNMLIRSPDNGRTWRKVGDISRYKDITTEVGLEDLGGRRIVAVMNHKPRRHTFLAFSSDMGKTWTRVKAIEKDVRIWDRPRIWSLKHFRGEPDWWEGRTLIGVGDEAVKRGQSQPRRNSLWISRNGGKTWRGPFPLDEQTQNAGYGDVIYDPQRKEYHFFSYHGRSSEAALVQYRFTLHE